MNTTSARIYLVRRNLDSKVRESAPEWYSALDQDFKAMEKATTKAFYFFIALALLWAFSVWW